MGDEIADALIGPLLGGLFAGDVDRLSVEASFPELARWERAFGSLIRGARAALVAARDAGPMFLRPCGGVSPLPRALLQTVGPARVRMGAPVGAIGRDGAGFDVRTDRIASADAVLLATPAFVASELVPGDRTPAAEDMDGIAYASTGVALLVYPEGTADALPEATGFVVPRGRAPMTACTFLSRKWPQADFGTRAVVRCFVGAVGFEDILDAPDEDIVQALSGTCPRSCRCPVGRPLRRWSGGHARCRSSSSVISGACENRLPAAGYPRRRERASRGGCRRRRPERRRGRRAGPCPSRRRTVFFFFFFFCPVKSENVR